MTKEEMLQKNGDMRSIVHSREFIIKSMDEYAKQQAIAFAIDYAQRKLTWLKSLRQTPDPESVEKDRMEERYSQFIKQQSESK